MYLASNQHDQAPAYYDPNNGVGGLSPYNDYTPSYPLDPYAPLPSQTMPPLPTYQPSSYDSPPTQAAAPVQPVAKPTVPNDKYNISSKTAGL
jgi:hypothetical protein